MVRHGCALRGIEDAHLVAERALVAPMFAREAGVHDRDRLFRVAVVDGEIAAFENLQSERGEVAVGDGFGVALRPIAIGHVALPIDFVLAEVGEGHAETIGHRRAFESRIGAQGAHGALEEFAARFFGRIIAFEQGHARGVNAVFVVAVVELGLIADRFDLQGRGDEQRGGHRDLPDHEDARDDVDEPAAVAAPAFFHHFGGISARTREGRAPNRKRSSRAA